MCHGPPVLPLPAAPFATIHIHRGVHFGVVQNCHNFHKRTQPMPGGRVVQCHQTFFKNVVYGHCDFATGSQNQHFQSTLFVGRGSQKEVFCVCS